MLLFRTVSWTTHFLWFSRKNAQPVCAKSVTLILNSGPLVQHLIFFHTVNDLTNLTRHYYFFEHMKLLIFTQSDVYLLFLLGLQLFDTLTRPSRNVLGKLCTLTTQVEASCRHFFSRQCFCYCHLCLGKSFIKCLLGGGRGGILKGKTGTSERKSQLSEKTGFREVGSCVAQSRNEKQLKQTTLRRAALFHFFVCLFFSLRPLATTKPAQ